jgi:hypothetical protein
MLDGFGGLVVSMLASGSRIRGFETDRSRWIFSDVKKSSARRNQNVIKNLRQKM